MSTDGGTPNSLTTAGVDCVGGTGIEEYRGCLGLGAAEACVAANGTCETAAAECYQEYLHPASEDNSDLWLGLTCDLGTADGTFCVDEATTTACETGGGDCRGFGPYFNGEITEDPDDICADIQQDLDATFDTQLFPIVCQDENGNGQADVWNCTVWANSDQMRKILRQMVISQAARANLM